MTARYTVVDGSLSAHCCFEATVVDTAKPLMIAGRHWNNEFRILCECLNRDDAKLIVDALNAKGND